MSPWHWLIVIAIALLLFGAKRLPDAARSLGRSARILKAELHDGSPAPTSSDPGSEKGSEQPVEHTRRADDHTGT